MSIETPFPQTADRETLLVQMKNHHSAHKIPPTSKRHFKGENIDRLTKLIQADTITELDLLYACGELNDEDLLEYFSHLPEFQRTLRNLDQIIQNMFEHVKKSLPAKVKQCANSNNGNLNLYSIMEVFTEVIRVGKTYMKYDPPLLFTSIVIGRFIKKLTTIIGLEFLREMDKLNLPGEKKSHICDFFLRIANQTYTKNMADDVWPLIPYAQFRNVIVKGTNKYSESYKDLMSGDLSKTDENPEQSAQSANEKYDAIMDLKALVGATYKQKYFGRASIEIVDMDNHLDALSKAPTSFQFRINFEPQPEEKYQPCFLNNRLGHKSSIFNVDFRYFEGTIDRATGEICMTPGITFQHILGEKNTLKLQHLIFDTILEHLAERELEIHKRPSLRPQTAIPKTPDLISKSTTEAIDKTIPSSPVPIEFQNGQWDYEKSANPLPMPSESAPEVPEEEDSEDLEYKKRLRGLKGNIVLKTLKALLQLVRINGSHYIFTCKNGQTYPIAIHRDKDVGTGMLISCLKKFGITPREFCENL